MHFNRLSGDGVFLNPPRSTEATPTIGAFVVLPGSLPCCFGRPTGGVDDLYRLAYQQARAALAPPWHERQWLASSN